MRNIRKHIIDGAKWITPFILFAIVLTQNIPESYSKVFSSYSGILFLALLITLYISFRLPAGYQFLTLSIILLMFAIVISYKWTSGYSDNKVIGGLLPYKDGKSYYEGALLILRGDRLNAGRSTWRPLFSAFLSSVLWLTGQNLKLTLAILVAAVGFGSFLSGFEISKAWGALPASLYTVFIFFYIQYFIGITATELLGLALGCIAFILLFRAANYLKWFDIVLGLITLTIAVSARAGAFFIFPFLILWIGWIFRGSKGFSLRAALIAFSIIVLTYLAGNTLLLHMVGADNGASFGNFAYSFYGQVRGGTGWHSAIEILGTRDTAKVFEAALRYFIEHPFSFIIGSLKAYRDFFFPGPSGIFFFTVQGKQAYSGITFWIISLGVLAFSIFKLRRHIHFNISSLLIASFIGVMLSVPFLPPIDGGSRFYASTMPFFFALLSVGLVKFPIENPVVLDESNYSLSMTIIRITSIAFSILIIPLPLMINFIHIPESIRVPECLSDQNPFVVLVSPGSYIDIVRPEEASCGLVPSICYEDFERNGNEKGIDDFYDQLLELAGSSKKGVRIILANNLVDQASHYIIQDFELFPPGLENRTISGCATNILTTNQSIYLIKSIQK
jgi:hypothetical protein